MVYLFISALIFLNGIFAMSEIALVSSRKSKLKELVRKKKRGARTALEMAKNPVIFFSTIQVGVTLVGVILGALGDQTLAPALEKSVKSLPFAEAYYKPVSFIITVGLLTYATLIIGELVPKRIAVNDPEIIASTIAPFIRVLYLLTFPLIRFFGKSTELVLRFLKVRKHPLRNSGEEESAILSDKENREGWEGEQADTLYFSNLPVNTFMTQRADIQWFDIDTYSQQDIRNHYGTYPYSQVIFCSESLDNVVGVIHIKDLLRYYLNDSHFNIRKAMLKPPVFPENALALEVLDRFESSPAQMAFIKDEDGKTKGMVTPDDIIRACMKNGRYGRAVSAYI